MRCIVFVKATKDSENGVMPSAELLAAMGSYNEELLRAGIMLGGGGLRPTSQGKRVRFSGDKRTVIDGPFAPTGEQVAGYWLWEVKSIDEAVEWLKRCPNPMRWAVWGEMLITLHINTRKSNHWLLERIDVPDEKAKNAGLAPKAMLHADPDSWNIQLDSETQLTGVPAEAWTYKLGNRSALECKEKTLKDPTIREKFNTYRFADHKEKVIDLLKARYTGER